MMCCWVTGIGEDIIVGIDYLIVMTIYCWWPCCDSDYLFDDEALWSCYLLMTVTDDVGKYLTIELTFWLSEASDCVDDYSSETAGLMALLMVYDTISLTDDEGNLGDVSVIVVKIDLDR